MILINLKYMNILFSFTAHYFHSGLMCQQLMSQLTDKAQSLTEQLNQADIKKPLALVLAEFTFSPLIMDSA